MSVGNFHALLGHPKVPQFELTSSPVSITEGNSFIITLNTQRITNGTTVGYTISGISANDLTTPGSLTGNFTISNNVSNLNVTTSVNDDIYLFIAARDNSLNTGIFRYSANPDLSSPVFLNSLINNSISPLGMYFKPDGSLLFIQDPSDELFKRYSFTASPSVDQWNLIPLSATPFTGSYGNTGTNHQGMWISETGIHLFQVDRDLKYILQDGIPSWNPLNPGLPSRLLNISADAALPSGISVKPDGTKAFVSCLVSPQAILEYSGTSFQCDSWTLTNTLPIAGAFPSDVYVTNLGTEMYVTDDNAKIYYFTLTDPWVLSSASLINTLNLSATYNNIYTAYIARPTKEQFKITIDETDSASNRTGSRFVEVTINES